MNQMNIYYDEEGDFLEISTDTPNKSYCKDIGEGIFERIDEKTGKIVGIGVLSFKKRTSKLDELKLKLPVKLQISS